MVKNRMTIMVDVKRIIWLSLVLLPSAIMLWLGGNCTVLPGVTISDNSIIAAGAVMSADVPPNVVVGGVPARVLKQL